MPETVALIVAAGHGNRAGSGPPKQYVEIAGRPLLSWTVAAFAAHPRINGVRVVIDPAWRRHYDRSVDGFNLDDPIAGGATRQGSVAAGLEALAENAPERVLIHDAARPFVAPRLIDGVLDALDETDGALPGVAVVDTLKRCMDGRVQETVPRAGLWQAQNTSGIPISGDFGSAPRSGGPVSDRRCRGRRGRRPQRSDGGGCGLQLQNYHRRRPYACARLTRATGDAYGPRL